jgi:zinc protease
MGPYQELRRFTLDNGCIVLILPSHKAATVAVYVAVRSGSADESSWLGMGLSHFVEHMFFKGTPTRDKGTIERQVREMGGYINAYTSHDNTVFYLTALSRHAESAIDLMYDASFHPLFDSAELEKERQVILAEQRMTEDQLSRKTAQTLWELAFLRHPYRHPIIGYPEIFSRSTREDLVNYFTSRYTPNQMVVCVVGDINPEDAERWIRDRFGREPRALDPSVARETEPAQVSPRNSVFRRPAEHARLALGFPGVSLTHGDAPALDILAQVLGDGASSRLYQVVKEKQRLALEVSASSANLRDAGIIDIDAVCLPADLPAAQKSILNVIEEIKKSGPTEIELQRAKTQALAQHYHGWESHGSLAHDLVTSEIYTGDCRYSEFYLKRLERVSASDVIRVAKVYLTNDRLNEVRLIPESTNAERAGTPTALSDKRSVERLTLSNGLRVLVLEDPSIPVVYAQASFRGGAMDEGDAANGSSALIAELLLRGTKTLDQKAIADQVADWGGDMSSYSGQHTFGITLAGLSKHAPALLDLMTQMLTESKFSQDEWDKAWEDQLQSVLAEKEDIYNASNRFLATAFYGPHPYHLSPNGSEASLKSLKKDQVVSFYNSRLAASRMVIGVAGDIKAAEVQRILEKRLGQLPARDALPSVTHPAQTPPAQAVRLRETLKREQSVVMLAFRSVSLTDPDRYAYQVLNAVMSGSAGRLYQNIRSRNGLSYVINSGLQIGLDPGHFVFYAGVKPSEAGQVQSLFYQEASKLRADGILDEELKQAQEQLIGSHEQAMESSAGVLQEAVTDEILGLGFEEMGRFSAAIRAVKKADVDAVIKKYVNPDASVGLWVGPKEK